MSSAAEQMRAWTGPVILTYGFRPFFLGAAAWAALAMGLWVPMLSGLVSLPTAFDPVSWHAHEFLFGTLGAVIAGFLLTAVPNWTGQLPIVGWRLGGLALLWLAGRIAVGGSGQMPAGVAATLDLAFPVVLAGAIGREIVAGRNWRILIVLAMLAVFAPGNGVFHWEAARGIYVALVVAVLARVAAGLWPKGAGLFHSLSGIAWIGAYGGFAAIYGRLLLRRSPAKRI
ncbi:MAG: NnrS family protein [Paracoccaceae bacterium]